MRLCRKHFLTEKSMLTIIETAKNIIEIFCLNGDFYGIQTLY